VSSVSFSFFAAFFSEDVCGKGARIMNATTSLLNMIHLPLADGAFAKLGGNFFWPYFLYTLGMFPCFIMAWRINEYAKRRKLRNILV